MAKLEVHAYSRQFDGLVKVSKNFAVREFACKDGSDAVFVSPKLVEILQKVRDHFGKPITINSAYRTPTHNKAKGGATYSTHQYGGAADIVVQGINPKYVADYVETLLGNSGGLGRYGTFTHVDVRGPKSRWNG